MSVYQLTANVPKLISHFDGVVTVYIKDYGAGNLRIGFNKEDLLQNIGTNLAPGAILDGIAQAAAAGFQFYFWSGDLWLISDQNDAVVVLAPAQSTYIDRFGGVRQRPADVTEEFARNDLSTY